MTNNWKVKKLGEVTDVYGGGTPRRSVPEYWGNDIPWLTMEDTKNFNVMGTAQYISNQGLQNSNAQLVPAGSVNLSCTATVGNVTINRIPLTTNQQFNSFHPHDELVPEFLAYDLIYRKNEIQSLGGTTTIPFISKTSISNLNVFVPPKDTQKKIADILSSLDEAIQITDQIIRKSEELKQGLMTEMLNRGIGHKTFKNTTLGKIPDDWNVVSLNEVAKVTNGQVDPKKEPYSSMILIAPNHIEPNSGRILEKVNAKDQQAISGKYLVNVGDVIYSKIRPYLKKVTIAEENCLCSADMYPMKGLGNLDNRFLFHILLSKAFTAYANSSSGRTGIPKINREELGGYKFALPTLKEQILIADILSSIDKEISTNQQIKAKNIQLKSGLMHDIFNQKIQIN